MKISRIIVSLAAASVLALSACGGDTTDEETTAAETTAAAPETTEEAATEAATDAATTEAATEAATDAAGTESTDVATDAPASGEAQSPAIQQFLDAHPNAMHLTVEQMAATDPSMGSEGQTLEPQACNDVTQKLVELQSGDDVVREAAMAGDQATGNGLVLTVVDFGDAGKVKEVMDLVRKSADACSDMSVTTGGQTVSATASGKDIQVAGADEATSQVTESTIGEQKVYTHSAYAVKGGTMLTAQSNSSSAAPDEAVAEQALADAVGALG